MEVADVDGIIALKQSHIHQNDHKSYNQTSSSPVRIVLNNGKERNNSKENHSPVKPVV